jgi:hypothetical protein
MAPAAIPIAIALTAASTGYQIYSSEQQKKAAKQERKKMEGQAAAEEAQLNEQKKLESQRKNEMYKIAQNRARMGSTRNPTIMTSPLGLPGAFTAPKTLLGQ